jgi:two-component sensor histidine kinase
LEWGFDAGDGTLRLTWRERGGPAVVPPARAGFGSRLLDTLAGRQLGGALARDWAGEGLTATLALPARHVASA